MAQSDGGLAPDLRNVFAARIAAGNALPSPDEPSTSKPRTTQPAADSDMDNAEPRPSRERKAPERIEVGDLRSFATGKRRSAHSCCPSHMDTDPSTSEPAPQPKFTGPMDKFLSDKRVEAAVNRAVKSITDNPADLERELRDFARTGEEWRQKSMSLEQENEAIRKKLDNHDVETRSCLPFLIGKVCQTPLLAFGDSFFKSKR